MKKSTVILVIGIIVFLLGAYQNSKYEDAIANGYKIEALITRVEIDESNDAAMDDSYDFYGEYEVDGKVYKNKKLGSSTIKRVVGDTYEVVVNPDSPGKNIAEGGWFLIAGFFMIIGAVVSKVKARKNENRAD